MLDSLTKEIEFDSSLVQNLNKRDYYPIDATKEIIEKFVTKVGDLVSEQEAKDGFPLLNEEEVRGTISRTKLIFALLLPIVLHLMVNVLTQVLKLNLEGLTGGFFRVITGVLAYTSLEILITVAFLWAYFRVVLIRLNNSLHRHTILDFLKDYVSLTPWQRIKVDLLVFSFVCFLVLINTIVLLNQLQAISQ